jgi:hypothetical protein
MDGISEKSWREFGPLATFLLIIVKDRSKQNTNNE